MLTALKSWDRDRSDMDEAIALLMFGDQLAAKYTELKLNVPEWLAETIRSIRRDIEEKRRDYKVKELKRLESKLSTIKERTQTVEDVSAQIAALKSELGE